MAQPKVTLAAATAFNIVRVTYDQDMEQSSPGQPEDVRTATNYTFETSGGNAVTAVSVALIVVSPGNTVVDVTLDGEMTNGATYYVTVANVENQTAEVIDPAFDSYAFAGLGVAPQLSSATALTATDVIVTFDEAMRDEPALRQTSNYSFNGPTFTYATEVKVLSPTQVQLTVSETMLDGGAYTVRAFNVRDTQRNVIDPLNDTAAFTGVGTAPELIDVALAPSSTTLKIMYDRAVVVSEATNIANYAIAPVLAISAIEQLTDLEFLVTMDTQTPGQPYTLTVTVGTVHDLYGNAITAGNETEFFGNGESPPTIDFIPEADSSGFPVRSYLHVIIEEPTEDFTGLDESSVFVLMRRALFGEEPERVLVAGGSLVTDRFDVAVQHEYTNSILKKLTYRIRPKGGVWEESAAYVPVVLAQDDDGSQNFEFIEFRTGVATHFEDDLPAVATADTQILTALPAAYPHTEKLRRLLLQTCTESHVPQVQARTLLHYAAVTELRTLLAGTLDFALVDEYLFGDLYPIEQIAFRIGVTYRDTLIGALNEVLPQETRALLGDYLKKQTPLYPIGVACVMVAMLALEVS